MKVLILAGLLAAETFGGEALRKTQYRVSPEYYGLPDAVHATRSYTGVPSIAVAPNGRLWATWYCGFEPAENEFNFAVLATSADDGRTWKEVLLYDPDGYGPARAYDPELWISPDGKLRWTFGLSWNGSPEAKGRPMPKHEVMLVTIDDPTSDDLSSVPQPVKLADGVMMCKPVVLSDGRWMFPVARWGEKGGTAFAVSADRLKTLPLAEIGSAYIDRAWRGCDEHTLVELKDGRLWTLVRSNREHHPWEAFSSDGGRTWDVKAPARIEHTDSRLFLRRLKSGNLLLVKHGRIDENCGRRNARAYISRDDGETWEGGLPVTHGTWGVYPDGDQGPDGRIYLVHDGRRTTDRDVRLSVFTEADALAGHDVSGKVRIDEIVTRCTSPRAEVPPRYIGPAVKGAFKFADRAHVGAPSVAVSASGRLWLTWHTGAKFAPSDYNDYAILATSTDDGRTWREELAVDPDFKYQRRPVDPVVRISADGRLDWTWRDVIALPTAEETWLLRLDAERAVAAEGLPAPVRTATGVEKERPDVLAEGLKLRNGTCLRVARGPHSRKLVASLSSDGGKTWSDGLLLDARDRLTAADAAEGPDGRLWIAWGRSRNGEWDLKLATVSAKDVRAGGTVAGGKVRTVMAR